MIKILVQDTSFFEKSNYFLKKVHNIKLFFDKNTFKAYFKRILT